MLCTDGIHFVDHDVCPEGWEPVTATFRADVVHVRWDWLLWILLILALLLAGSKR